MPDDKPEVSITLTRDEAEYILGICTWIGTDENCDCEDCSVARKLRTALGDSNA